MTVYGPTAFSSSLNKPNTHSLAYSCSCDVCVVCGQVIPQLIARIDTPRQLVAKLIQQLLIDIGKQHPQVSQTAPAGEANNTRR